MMHDIIDALSEAFKELDNMETKTTFEYDGVKYDITSKEGNAKALEVLEEAKKSFISTFLGTDVIDELIEEVKALKSEDTNTNIVKKDIPDYYDISSDKSKDEIAKIVDAYIDEVAIPRADAAGTKLDEDHVFSLGSTLDDFAAWMLQR